MTVMHKGSKIFVAGHRGLVGNAIVEQLKVRGYTNLILKSRAELDLRNSAAVDKFYETERPDIVFDAAAKVGGIVGNNLLRADFIAENLQIQNNVVWGAHKVDVKRLVFLGTSCIYPRNAPQPMLETSLLQGELEYTNRPYALAKIAGLELVDSLRKQYGRDYFSTMPTNVYGPGDNYHPVNAHVMPMLIRRFHEAKLNGLKEVAIWGTGSPYREFIYSHDCADAIVFLAEKMSTDDLNQSYIGKANWSHINVGTGDEVRISELADMIKKATRFDGRIVYDSTKPDGTPRKLLDSRFLREMGWKPKVKLQDGLISSTNWFIENSAHVRSD